MLMYRHCSLRWEILLYFPTLPLLDREKENGKKCFCFLGENVCKSHYSLLSQVLDNHLFFTILITSEIIWDWLRFIELAFLIWSTFDVGHLNPSIRLAASIFLQMNAATLGVAFISWFDLQFFPTSNMIPDIGHHGALNIIMRCTSWYIEHHCLERLRGND